MNNTTIEFRCLKNDEIDLLKSNNNQCSDWTTVFITNAVDLNLIRGCRFAGSVHIEELEAKIHKTENLTLNSGLYNSFIRDTYLETGVTIDSVALIDGYRIAQNTLLFDLGGLYKGPSSGNPETIFPSNENGGRPLLPFSGMLPADAALWYHFAGNAEWQEHLTRLTIARREHQSPGHIGPNSTLLHCRQLLNISCGERTTLSGCQHIQDVMIESSAEEPTFIGSGVIIEKSFIGYGNRIVGNSQVKHVQTCRNVEISSGARVSHCFIGDNSTIACAEVQHNLLYPFHEQHHNNSFLIAATLEGQSNIAAGATIGSNHNSRAADGEIFAKRGFWPGLCTSFKHNSRFSSFTLAAKGDYQNELNIPLPFSLISTRDDGFNISLMPAFWFKYNMYALARNSWKFLRRDRRALKPQAIETEFLAPDTVLEMLQAVRILHNELETVAGKKFSLSHIAGNAAILDKKHHIQMDGIVNKGRAQIIKAAQGIQIYRNMLIFYGWRKLLSAFGDSKNNFQFRKNTTTFKSWMNLGGQLLPTETVLELQQKIRNKSIDSWDQVHTFYRDQQAQYDRRQEDLAQEVLLQMYEVEGVKVDNAFYKKSLVEFINICETLVDWAISSRQKDETSEFRKMVYRDQKQMQAILGKAEENPFLSDYREEMENLKKQAKQTITDLN